MSRSRSFPLVHEQHFAHATRETGYKSTASAVSELIDNSVQAGAKSVKVVVQEERPGREREVRIAVCDDGCGMNARELRQALQFGGSSQFNDRGGLGRFGMGLPNASVSQARRVEVYSRKHNRTLWTYLDLDEIARGNLKGIPDPRAISAVPTWTPGLGGTGTLVVWAKCDRLDYRKVSTIRRKLLNELGRTFRHLLSYGLKITVNGDQVAIVDPLFRLPRAKVDGAQDHGVPLRYTVKVSTNEVKTATIEVRFTKLPVHEWNSLSLDEKRRIGIVGGAGVFVVRAGREIAHGWYFMDGKSRQNYDDWWRCEVAFPPSLDELFGVTHSKQGIRPSEELNEMLSPDIGRIARALSRQVRIEFAALTPQPKNRAAMQATAKDWRLPPLPRESRGRSTVSRLEYRVEAYKNGARSFFEWSRDSGRLVIRLNKNHPFYSQLLGRLEGRGVEWVKQDLETVLLAYARASEMQDREYSSFEDTWSDVLSTFLGN